MNLAEDLIELISKKEDEYKNDKIFNDFEKINLLFEDLVKKGLTQKRGNNLLSTTDSHLIRNFNFEKITFNKK